MRSFFFALFLFCLLSGCKKSQTADNCEQIQQVKITGARLSYYVGDTIQLATSLVPDALYIWHSSSDPNQISGSPGVFIYPCSKYDEGMYTLAVGNPDCSTKIDSVYIHVINKPEAPPCNPGNNSVSFSGIPGISFSSASWGLDPGWNCRNLSGSQSPGYPDINIYFNPYWNTIEPEDGPYSTTNEITFPDDNLYTVFIASTYEGVYFQANPGTVYVTHVGGKIQVTFCGITLTGEYGGTGYTTGASGRLTAP
jgi:hypothetical protein